ncbi:hypothetical protein K505DRAFT_322609 [Melanomma pulvis-pyrius CBS 109.77]|uniref:Acid phosphatase-like protein n=1 Tax=Melanomma pulvis-pyrius CBS 109.77 TaxID=1314802 RepID=A0A6A6XMF9_9PLEO|nr:hypothetical protein K505DRAFT_322609 [Melanomma pulvis-pyrius CBS 109.77]
MNGGVIFLIVLLFLLIFGFGGWTLYSRLRAKRLGLPPPSLNPFARSSASTSNYPAPAPGGIQGFIQTQIRKFKNRNNRSAAGAYEEPSGYAARGRGANRLDPDEAWDAHVGNEAYYEEQELGLHAPLQHQHQSTPYGAPSPGFAPAEEPARGRSRTREYEDANTLHGDSRSARENPFGDENAASLRGVSPRPLDYGQDTSYGGASAHATAAPAPQKPKKTDSAESSPTESRRSVFRENM